VALRILRRSGHRWQSGESANPHSTDDALVGVLARDIDAHDQRRRGIEQGEGAAALVVQTGDGFGVPGVRTSIECLDVPRP
jgi:hypothetical protein